MAFRDARDIADELRDTDLVERRAAARKLELVAELALQYELGDEDVPHPALHEEDVPVGGPGVPAVSEFLALELGALLGITARKATALIGQVLQLKYRHGSLWAGVCELRVDTDRALRAASVCWDLPDALVERVTAAWLPTQTNKGWVAAFNDLDRLIAFIAPEVAAEKERKALEARRFVLSQPLDGVTSLYAQMDPIDARFLAATVDQVADLLAMLEGDEDNKQLRRVKALGVLAHPALALAMQQQALQQPLLDIGPDPVPPECAPVDDGPPLPAEPPTDEVAGPVSVRRGDPHACLGHACGRITQPVDALRPQVEIVIHVDAAAVCEGRGVARIEQIGDITSATLRELLIDKQVTVRPVIDLPTMPPQHGYQPSERTRDAILALFPVEPFPFSTQASRGLDIDHTVAYRGAGPPGQTGIGNLAPLSRRLHRAKTAGHWKVTQPEPGILVWESPLGYRYRVHGGCTETLDDAA